MRDLLLATFFFIYAAIIFFSDNLTLLEFQIGSFLVILVGVLLTFGFAMIITDTFFFDPIYKLLEEKPEEPEDYQI